MSQGLPQFDSSFYSGEIFWLLFSFGILWGCFQFWIMPHFYSLEKQRKKSLDYILKEMTQLEEKISSLRISQKKRLADVQRNIDHDRHCILEKYSQEKQQENTKIRLDYEHSLRENEKKYKKRFQEEKESLDQKKIKELLDDFIQAMKK